MEFLHFQRLSDTDHRHQVYDIVKKCDLEFVPPLSQRESTTQRNLTSTASAETAEPKSYFQNLCAQSVILAVEGAQVLGFISFLEQYLYKDDREQVPTVYVTTVIVDPAYRRHGATASMYQKLIEIAQTQQLPITTRTWSTNHAHIKILLQLGFRESMRIRDGRGKGIDTIYFRKD